MALSIFLFFRPFEFIFGGWDPGVYVNTGFHIAATGSITIHDPFVAAISPEARSILYPPVARPWYQAIDMLGFYIRHFSSGEIIPQFFHVYPVWIAMLTAIGGIKLGLFVTPIFALLGVLGVFFLTRRLFGLPAAILAGLFLPLSTAEIWFARFPVSETMTQTFFFAGLFCFVLMLDVREKAGRPAPPLADRDVRHYESDEDVRHYDGDSGSRTSLANYLGIVSGVSFGLVQLTKIEMLFIAPIIVLLLAYQWINRRFTSEYKCFAAAYFFLLAHSALHAVTLSAPYTFDVFNAVITNAKPVIALVALAIIGAVAVMSMRDRVARVVGYLLRYEKPASSAFVGVVFLVAGWAYFIRPDTETPQKFLAANGLLVRTFIEDNFVRFGWYVTPLGLALGIIGFSQKILAGMNRRIFLFIVPAFLYGAVFAWSGFIYSSHFWAARRLVPIVIPAFIVFASYALVNLRSFFGRSRIVVPLTIATVAIILWIFLQASGPVIGHVEYAGAIDKVGALAQKFSSNSVVLVEDSDAGVMLSTPLQIIYGIPGAILPKGNASKPEVKHLLDQWRKQGKKIFWISSQGDTEPVASGYVLDPVSSYDISLPQFERRMDKFPTRDGTVDLLLDIFRVVPGTEQTSFVKPNLSEDASKWKGFYPAEQQDGEWFRWSGGVGEITTPKPAAGSDSFLMVRMAGGTPLNNGRREATIYVDDKMVRQTVLPEQMKSFAIPLTKDLMDGGGTELRVRIEPSKTWNLKDVDPSSENREVGVKVAWVSVNTIDAVGIKP